jgi:large subunit ribosomal protein L25
MESFMQAQIEFQASERPEAGKGQARAVRRAGNVPVVVYGNGKAPVSLAVDANHVTTEYRKGGFKNKVVALKTEKSTFFGLPRDMQFHPVSDKIEHVDFMHVDEKSTVRIDVPVRFLNREKCPGLKRGGALNIVRRAIECFANVQHIPSSVDLDLAKVNIGDSVHISHITLPEGVTPTITDRDFTICSVTGRSKEKEETGSAEAAAEGGAAEGNGEAKASE